jgi:hypothetical protein
MSEYMSEVWARDQLTELQGHARTLTHRRPGRRSCCAWRCGYWSVGRQQLGGRRTRVAAFATRA